MHRSTDTVIIKSLFISTIKKGPRFVCGTLLLYLLDNFCLVTANYNLPA